MNPARSTLQDDSKGRSTFGRGPPADNPGRTTIQKEDQMQLERKKHQEMVQRAARDRQQKNGSDTAPKSISNGVNEDEVKPEKRNIESRKLEDQIRSQNVQSTQEMTRSAAEASAKRAKKAQDASVSASQVSSILVFLVPLAHLTNFFYKKDGVKASKSNESGRNQERAK